MCKHVLTTYSERGDEGALIGPTDINCAKCGMQWSLCLGEMEEMFDALLLLAQYVAPVLLGRLLEGSEGEKKGMVIAAVRPGELVVD